MPESLDQKLKRLQGPVLILGASGFIGAHLLRAALRVRDDVFGTATRLPAWRLEGLPPQHVKVVDLLVDSGVDELLAQVQPRTILDCVAYGAYSFETDSDLIYQTNFNRVARLLERLARMRISAYVHAGSSSEYGDNASGPAETATLAPNSHYAVSKASASDLIYFYGKKLGAPVANLRLYSVYGPLEDSSRLIPTLVRLGVEGTLPEFVDPNTSRDFIFIDDAVESFVDTALQLREELYGESFNVGSGVKTTIAECAQLAKDVFAIRDEPVYTMPGRSWDVSDWYARIDKIRSQVGWAPRTSFREGLLQTAEWFRALPDPAAYLRSSKRYGLDTRHSVSAIIACYKDGQAIPVMYERLTATFRKLNIDYEIIFVNDNSPDDSEERIRALSRNDRRVKGISHSRNFGSQSAFRSGLEISSKNACVLLDGDLQDPPELIESMVARWREGFDVVYGRRVQRETTLFMQASYKLFYRLFDYFSYVRIPHDAGDFSLMDKRVVQAILRFPERDFFLRGVRAFAGFKQTGIDYNRPERMFGVTTNSLLKNIGWAKKGIFAYSYAPLNAMSALGFLLVVITVVLALVQFTLRLVFPAMAPKGATTIILAILFFGAVNLAGLGILGEYLAKVFEEVKRRPPFIRRSIIQDGEVRFAPSGRDVPSDL